MRRPIRSTARTVVLVLPLLVLAACAGPAKLAQQSEKQLGAGQTERAWQLAKRAVDKDPNNERARAARDAAARVIADDWKRRIREGAIDTLGAARQSLRFDEFRAELARYGGSLPPDPEFDAIEHGLRSGAAAITYRMAEDLLADRRPRQAYHTFVEAQSFHPGYRDLSARIAKTHDLAIARVAVLPVVNQTGLDGLSRDLDRAAYEALGRRIGRREFLRLIDRRPVLDGMTVAQLFDLPRAEAAAIGRKVGADLVIRGRIHGERSVTDTDRYRETIFRRITERDTLGKSHSRYVDFTFQAVARRRVVGVNYDFEILDAETAEVLAERSQGVEAAARTVFSDFNAAGDGDDYCLVPPDLKRSDSRRAAKAEDEWKRVFGSWTLPQLLEISRDHADHRYYRRQHAPDFRQARPVFLGELPPDEDLARIALEDLWKPMLSMLEEVDEP